MSNVELLRADTIDALNASIVSALADGWDLYGGLIAGEWEIGQWVVRLPGNYEYRLVQAPSFELLERECLSLVEAGWEFYYWTITWKKQLCQWMLRWAVAPFRMQIVTARGTESIVESAVPYVRGNTTDGETLVYESRHTRILNTTSLLTLTDTMTALDIERDAEDIFNVLRILPFPVRMDVAVGFEVPVRRVVAPAPEGGSQ